MSNAPGYLTEVFTSIQGEGSWVGHRQIFLRLAGCQADCDYCDTPGRKEPKPERWQIQFPPSASVPLAMANPVTAVELAPLLWNLLLSYGPFHSLAITGGEPLEQPEFLKSLLLELKRQHWNLPILLETNGCHPASFKKVRHLLKFVSADIKLPSATGNPTLWRQHDLFLKSAQRLEGCVKLVVVPKTSEVEVAQAARMVRKRVPLWDLIVQPAAGAAWKAAAAQKRLEALVQTAAQIHARVRLIPQIHPGLGWR